jgi:hypothetical protein
MTLNEIYILETGNETFANNCEKIADDYAIMFAHWCEWQDNKPLKTFEELLEIFKKEKGL